ncbi:polysaccharide biosynthesis protein, partial [Escherichia coli]
GPLIIFKQTYSILRKKNIKVIVTTGPGIAIAATLAAKLVGTKVIYIETWSRFTTYSLSGRIMYRLSNKFYIQNKSLLELYPKAIYSGRL